MAPTLSQIQSLDTSHLTDLDVDFTAEADLIEDSFSQMFALVKSSSWQGDANDAAVRRTDLDLVTARAQAEIRRDLAAIARQGAEDLRCAQRCVLDLVHRAQASGFIVEEDLSVHLYAPAGSPEDALALQFRAEEMASAIGAEAAMLTGVDDTVAAKLATASNGLTGLTFPEAPAPRPRQRRRYTRSDLYPHEPTAADINQDTIGDCYLDSTMGAIANADPQWIKDRISYDDTTGTFDVTLWNGTQWQHIPVTQDDVDTNIAKHGASWRDNGEPNAALWPSVLESAYAKMKAPNRTMEQSLREIGRGGYPEDAMEALTGNRGRTIQAQSVWRTREHIDQDIAEALGQHQPVTISTTGQGVPLVENHVYVVEGISGTGSDAMVTLRNPWETNSNTPIDTAAPTLTLRLGDLIGSGLPGPFGRHPMDAVNIGSLK